MNAATVAALRELLEDAAESLERVGCQFFACKGPTLDPIPMATCYICASLARVRAGLESSLPSFPPPPVLSTITDDDRVDHPEPGDEPSEPVPAWVDGFALPPRIRVDPDLRVQP